MWTETTLIIDDGETSPRPVVVFAHRKTVEERLQTGKPFYLSSPGHEESIRIDPAHVVGVSDGVTDRAT